MAAFKKVSELEKAAQLRIDEQRRLGEKFSQQQEQVRELQFDLKQAERRAGFDDDGEEDDEAWSFVETDRQGQPIKKKYRDRMVRSWGLERHARSGQLSDQKSCLDPHYTSSKRGRLRPYT